MKLYASFFSFFFFVFLVNHSFTQTTYINPEGSYELVSKTKKVKGETYGRFGSINVQRVSDTLIILQMDINRGALSYNHGMADGRLEYKDNQAIYTTDLDTSCFIIFTFSKKGITVVQTSAKLTGTCGFGHAVFADGFYKKEKGYLPSSKDKFFCTFIL